MKKSLILLLFIGLSALAPTSFAQTVTPLNWQGSRSTPTFSQTLTLDQSWSGLASVRAYTEPGGRPLSTLLQPTVSRNANVLTVVFPNTAGLSNSTYVMVRTDETLRFAGYLSLGSSTGTLASGTGGGTDNLGLITIPTVQGLLQALNEKALAADLETTNAALAARLAYVTSSGLFSTATADIVQFDNASWEKKAGTITSATPGYGGVLFSGPLGFYFKRKYDGYANVMWFLPDPTGVVDSYPAFAAAIKWLKNAGSVPGVGQLAGKLFVPRGVYGFSQRLVIPDLITALGEDSRTTEFRPLSATFFPDTIFLELSNKEYGGRKNTFSNGIDNISLDMRGINGLTAVYSEEINEQSGLRNFCIRNLQYIGIRIRATQAIVGVGPQNFYIEKGEIIFNNSENSASRGIVIDNNSGNFQSLRDISVVGKNITAWGIDISSAAGWGSGNIHFENLARGFSLADRGPVFAFTIRDVNVQNQCPVTVYIRGVIADSYGYTLMGIRSAAGSFAVQDFRNNPNRTNVPGPLGYYAVSSETYPNRNVRCTNVLFEKYFNLPTYSDNTAAAAGTVKVGELYQTSDGTLKRRTN